MERQFKCLGLPAQRIEAVTPADLSAADLKNYSDPKRFRWLTSPELACSFSHILALSKFVKSGALFCLIFEDDVIISARITRFIEAFEKDPPKLDILRLENSEYPLRLSKKSLAARAAIELLPFYSWCSGAAGYLVSRRGAQRIIAGEEIRITQADRALFNPYEPLARDLTILQALPALCKQKSNLPPNCIKKTDSDLDHARQSRSIMEQAYFPRRVLFNILEFSDRDLRIGALKLFNQLIRGAKKRAVPFNTE